MKTLDYFSLLEFLDAEAEELAQAAKEEKNIGNMHHIHGRITEIQKVQSWAIQQARAQERNQDNETCQPSA